MTVVSQRQSLFWFVRVLAKNRVVVVVENLLSVSLSQLIPLIQQYNGQQQHSEFAHSSLQTRLVG